MSGIQVLNSVRVFVLVGKCIDGMARLDFNTFTKQGFWNWLAR